MVIFLSPCPKHEEVFLWSLLWDSDEFPQSKAHESVESPQDWVPGVFHSQANLPLDSSNWEIFVSSQYFYKFMAALALAPKKPILAVYSIFSACPMYYVIYTGLVTVYWWCHFTSLSEILKPYLFYIHISFPIHNIIVLKITCTYL